MAKKPDLLIGERYKGNIMKKILFTLTLFCALTTHSDARIGSGCSRYVGTDQFYDCLEQERREEESDRRERAREEREERRDRRDSRDRGYGY